MAEVFGDFDDKPMDAATEHVDDSMEPDDTANFFQEVNNDDHMDSDHEMAAMMDVLQTLGVEAEVAPNYCASIMKTANNPTVTDVYGTGNMIGMANKKLRNLNVDGLCAFDLRVAKAGGTFGDFSKSKDRIEATEYIKREKPTWVIGSPPCTPFSQLQALSFPKMPPGKVAQILRQGRMHLHFVLGLYKLQLDGGDISCMNIHLGPQAGEIPS